MKLSALEPEGHGDESAEEVLDEIITGKPSHSERTTEEGVNHNKNIETSSQNNAIYEISPGVGLEPRSHSSGFMLFLILVHENETNLTFLNVLFILLFFY
jgi:hypothetical protein